MSTSVGSHINGGVSTAPPMSGASSVWSQNKPITHQQHKANNMNGAAGTPSGGLSLAGMKPISAYQQQSLSNASSNSSNSSSASVWSNSLKSSPAFHSHLNIASNTVLSANLTAAASANLSSSSSSSSNIPSSAAPAPEASLFPPLIPINSAHNTSTSMPYSNITKKSAIESFISSSDFPLLGESIHANSTNASVMNTIGSSSLKESKPKHICSNVFILMALFYLEHELIGKKTINNHSRSNSQTESQLIT